MRSLVIAVLAASAVSWAHAEEPAQRGDDFQPNPAWTRLGPSLWFDKKERQLVVRARVVFREGPLEHLLCLKGTKEHEAVLATDASPAGIHAGLLLTGASEGHPVRFLPKFEPPTGTAIAIEVRWRNEKGEERSADAREWVRDDRKKATLTQDWVFAGSSYVEDPITKKRFYAADEGDLFTVANFSNAILDLPFASTANDNDRSFVANTEKIPPRGTMVSMHLRPRQRPTKPAR